MEATELMLEEIAGEFATGFRVYLNTHTLEIIAVPAKDMRKPKYQIIGRIITRS